MLVHELYNNTGMLSTSTMHGPRQSFVHNPYSLPLLRGSSARVMQLGMMGCMYVCMSFYLSD